MLVFKENVKGFLLDTDKDAITQIFTEALSAEEVKLIRKVIPNDIILLMSEEEVNEEYSIWIEELIWDEIDVKTELAKSTELSKVVDWKE
jgi:hypothetical protein